MISARQQKRQKYGEMSMVQWFDDLSVRTKVMVMVLGAMGAIAAVYACSLYLLQSGAGQNAVGLLTWLSMGVALSGLMSGLFVASRLTNPMRHIEVVTRQLAAGNLDCDLSGAVRRDEIGRMFKALDILRTKEMERRELALEREREKSRLMHRAQSMCALADMFEHIIMAKIEEVKKASNGIGSTAQGMALRSEQSGSRTMETADAARISANRAADVSEATRHLAEAINEISHRVDNSSTMAQQAVAHVNETATRMESLYATAEGIGEVVHLISDIAAQTNLLALNATIEAARAGDAGKGFAVVAGEVKNLAAQTTRATDDIVKQVQAVQESARDMADSIGAIVNTIRSIEGVSTGIASAVQEQEATTRTIAGHIDEVAEQSGAVMSHVKSLSRSSIQSCAGSVRVIWDSNALMEVVGDLNDESEAFALRVKNAESIAKAHEVFFTGVISRAADIAARFERAVDNGDISMEALFDQSYQPIPGTNPQQFTTKYVELTDRLLPDLLESALELGEPVVFCAAVDRNGFLPTHNSKYSHPQGSDPKWNDANCRNRRHFKDNTGLAAATNTQELLVQSYVRQMGDIRQMMIDASAPIMVKGRHWGGLRLAFKA